eukprot:14449971-Alexandrium_andersonii.AAC.1
MQQAPRQHDHRQNQRGNRWQLPAGGQAQAPPAQQPPRVAAAAEGLPSNPGGPQPDPTIPPKEDGE